MPRTKRMSIPDIGLYYTDLLLVDAAINSRTAPVQAQSLLCAKLQEREKTIKERVEYIAKRDGKPFDEVWTALRDGTYSETNGASINDED